MRNIGEQTIVEVSIEFAGLVLRWQQAFLAVASNHQSASQPRRWQTLFWPVAGIQMFSD
jgi:hypothetical protein